MFEKINELDLNIELLLNNYVEIPNVGKLYCLTNNEIKKIKYSKYNQYLCLLCVESDYFKQYLTDLIKNKNITTFEYLVLGSYCNLEFRQLVVDALSIFFKEEIIYNPELLHFIVGIPIERRIIHADNYEYIKFIIKKQNGIQTEETEKFANSIAKQMADKLKQLRNKYNKINNDEQIYDYSDILSSVCAKHNSINLFNIGELTIYQTIDQFKRLNMIDKFEINIQSLLHGAKQEDIKLENWFNKIQI